MITPDMGATAFGVTAAYVFWKWLKEPGWELAVLAGLVMGAAQLTKTTWILLFGLWPVLWCSGGRAGGVSPLSGPKLAEAAPPAGDDSSSATSTL